MPFAAALLVAAWAGGGTGVKGGVHSGALLAAHVGLMLAGLAGLTVAAGMSALYLWEERQLEAARLAPLPAAAATARLARPARRERGRDLARSPLGGHRRRAGAASLAATSTWRWP